MAEQRLADRAERHFVDAAPAAAAHDDQLRVLSGCQAGRSDHQPGKPAQATETKDHHTHVAVNTSGNTVTLIGHVRTRAQRDAVADAAWQGHGVMVVLDELEITG